jgi:hypothetical protein
MKRLLIMAGICATFALASCKGNPDTASGDSTGTGAAGARVPSKVDSDTTRHDTTAATKMDSVKKK